MEFFDKKQEHSKVKLELLKRYLIPAISKMGYSKYNTKELVRIFDGFAGTGEYGDGGIGSPVIILNEVYRVLGNMRAKNIDKNFKVKLHYCEKKEENFEKLNLALKKRMKCKEEKKKSCQYIDENKGLEVFSYNQNFRSCIEVIMEKRLQNRERQVPYFIFIDPFGYKDTPMELFVNLMNSGKTEIMFNMMYEEINRFITKEDDKLNETHKNFFGCTDSDLRKLQLEIANKTSKERFIIITNFYKEKLREKNFYVNFLEIKKDNKIKMVIFLITKNKNGFILFKDIKHKIQSEIEAVENDSEQQKLFYEKNLDEKEQELIKNYILNKYDEKVEYEKLKEDVSNHEYFTENNLKKAINILCEENKIKKVKNGKINKREFNGTTILMKEGNNDK